MQEDDIFFDRGYPYRSIRKMHHDPNHQPAKPGRVAETFYKPFIWTVRYSYIIALVIAAAYVVTPAISNSIKHTTFAEFVTGALYIAFTIAFLFILAFAVVIAESVTQRLGDWLERRLLDLRHRQGAARGTAREPDDADHAQGSEERGGGVSDDSREYVRCTKCKRNLGNNGFWYHHC